MVYLSDELTQAEITGLAIYLSLVFLFVILGVLLFFHSRVAKSNRKNKMSGNRLNVYHFIIDLKDTTVTYFKQYSGSSMKTIHYEQFLDRIVNTRKRKMFVNWLINYSDDESLFSELEYRLDDDEIIYIYFVKTFNSENKFRFYLTGYPITYDKSEYRRLSASNNSYQGLSVPTLYLRKKGRIGYMIYIRFFMLNQEVDEVKQNIIINDLRSVCISFLKEQNTRFKIASFEKESFAFIDYVETSEDDYRYVIEGLARLLNARLKMNNYKSLYDFIISGASNKDFKDSVKCFETIKQNTYLVDTDGDKILWHNEDKFNLINERNIKKKEMELLIHGKNKDKKIKLTYQPLINIVDKSVLGYYCRCSTLSTSYSNLTDMLKKANEYGLSADFLEVIMRRLVTKFYREAVRADVLDDTYRFSQKLFLQISLYDKPHLLNVIEKIPLLSECNATFVFDEFVINNWCSENLSETIELLKEVKNNFQISLRLKDRSLPWPNELYELFDYFILDRHVMTDGERYDTSSAIKSITNKITKSFKAPLIALDIENANTYRLLRDKSFTIFAGDFFAKPNEGVVPPNLNKIGVLKK
ncbi:MAG: EAL domain-containing protein [Bacilli bacterium]|nr:EAL domain-containing protein [Bacilli bacterium]